MTGRSRILTWACVAGLSLTALGCGSTRPAGVAGREDGPIRATPSPAATPRVLGPLADPSLGLQAAPVAVPLRLRIPALQVDTDVLGVGQTKDRYMDAPKGPASDRVWQEAFWYRGGAEPGAPGVATIAAHVDDSLARPGPFAHLTQLRAGDHVEVEDTRTGRVSRFHIAETHVYTLAESTTTGVLQRLFGVGAVTERPEDRAADAASGIARLTLITCAGDFQRGDFNKRFVAYAVLD